MRYPYYLRLALGFGSIVDGLCLILFLPCPNLASKAARSIINYRESK